MTQINLNVQGISSASCIQIIKNALKGFMDIRSIHIDWESGRVQIEATSTLSEDLIHAINKAGYEASLDLEEQ